jgi:hypothetical protein
VNLGRLNLVVLATVVIFAAGVVTGSLIVKKTSRPPIAQPFWGRFEVTRRAIDELDRQGDLTPKQRARIDHIIQDNQGFTWNPSITGTKSEDTILATGKGPEPVTRPVLYPVLTVEAGGRSFTRPAVLELS